MVVRTFSDPICHTSGPLPGILNSVENVGLRLDVTRVQRLVSEGLDPKLAIAQLKEWGPLTKPRESAIRSCLFTIAAGGCSAFPPEIPE